MSRAFKRLFINEAVEDGAKFTAGRKCRRASPVPPNELLNASIGA